MKANADKYHLLLTRNAKDYSINFGGESEDSSSEEKRLGILIDNKLKSDKYINTLCKQTSNKVHMYVFLTIGNTNPNPNPEI